MPLKLINLRVPKDADEKMDSIARNQGKAKAELYREALEDYLSTYTQIPTLKSLWHQVERHEKRISDIEKMLEGRK